MKVLRRFLRQKVIDPVDLLLVEYRMDDSVERMEPARRRPEWLLVDHASALAQPVSAQGIRHIGKGDRWQRQVVNQPGIVADNCACGGQDVGHAAGVGRSETLASEQYTRLEPLPLLLFHRRAELDQHLMDMGTECLIRHIAAAVADQHPLPGQQSFGSKPVERRQNHPLGKVTGRAEQDEHRRAQIMAGLASPTLGHQTMSPTLTCSTAPPTSTTRPRFSCPSTRPFAMSERPSRTCTSVPQMPALVISTAALAFL